MRRQLWFRRALVALGVIVVGLVGLHLYNRFNLDLGALRANAAPVLEQARALSQQARPEYQDLAIAALPANPNNGIFYRLDDMLDRAVVTEAPPAATETAGVIASLEFDDQTQGDLKSATGALAIETSDGVLRVVTSGEEYLVNDRSIAVPRDEVGDILIRVKADKGTYLRMAWASEAGPGEQWIWKNRLDIRFNDNSDFHTYVINARNVLKRGLKPGEKLGRLYIQGSDVAGAKVELDFIRFLSKAVAYGAAGSGAEDETVGGELRSALYMRPDQAMKFAVKVPEAQPRLDFGMGVLLDSSPLRFEILVGQADGAKISLHDATVDQTERWVDVRLDLTQWAGQEIALELRSTGDPRRPPNVAFWSSPIVSSAPVKPFNVIVMVEDAERADYLSVYGHATPTTPFKERLMAERGIVFEQTISQANNTRPSVASFMTSLYPTATGSWHFSDVLSDRYLTMAEVLRSQGYVTASFIQNGNAGPYAGIQQGFDSLHDEVATGKTTEEVFTGDKIRRFLQQHRDRNFFLYLHAIDPHGVYDPPSPFRERFADLIGSDPTPVARSKLDAPWVEAPSVQSRRRFYEAEIAHNDSVVERFFAQLDELGLSQNTLVVMMSEHGEYLGEQGFLGDRLWQHPPPGYLIGTRVPLMMVYPARFTQPKRVPQRVQLLDLMPTVLDFAGVDRSGLMLQGSSLVGLIDGERPDYWRDRVIISEEPAAMLKGDPCSCGSVYFRDSHILSSGWVFPRGRRLAPELQTFLATNAYHVDPAHPTDELVASVVPDLGVRWFQRSLLSELRETNMATWRKLTQGSSDAGVIDPDTLERLRGLGYVN